MIYTSAQQWLDDPHKRVLLFGMSGLGKTHISNMLRASGNWFHYSIDYRIGTRYLGESINDNLKREAMKNPFLADLLKTDSIHLGSNISFDNLNPLSTYLGKPGDPVKGGIEISEYMRRQLLHEKAEVSALLDTAHFVNRARDLYQYDHFICDSGGSICEVVDPTNPDDAVLKSLSENLLLVWIKGSEAHFDELVNRFDKAPKPMCYRASFMSKLWDDYLTETDCAADAVNPDQFVRWAYAQALAQRQPRYETMAENWGVTVTAIDLARSNSPQDFDNMIADAIAAHRP